MPTSFRILFVLALIVILGAMLASGNVVADTHTATPTWSLYLPLALRNSSAAPTTTPTATPPPTTTFTVTNLNNSGVGSLRWAIHQSNLAGGANTINIAVTGTLHPGWSLPQITASVTINALAGNFTILSWGQTFFVQPGRTLTLSNIAIANGYTPGTWGGGAIYNDHGTVNLINCMIYNSYAYSQGGAIFNNGGSINIQASTIRDNYTYTWSGTSDIAAGGGLYNLDGTVLIDKSLFSGNSAWMGGGMYVAGGSVTVTNSTFNGNTAAMSVGGNGAAIYVAGGSVQIFQSTIAGNNATLYGGIYSANGWTTIQNSILANNAVAGNCAGNIIDAGNNLQFNPNWGCVGIASDPKLGALADNGGATQTMALQLGSAAINLASSGCPPVDQRGYARNLADGRCDVGAYEVGHEVGQRAFLPIILRK